MGECRNILLDQVDSKIQCGKKFAIRDSRIDEKQGDTLKRRTGAACSVSMSSEAQPDLIRPIIPWLPSSAVARQRVFIHCGHGGHSDIHSKSCHDLHSDNAAVDEG